MKKDDIIEVKIESTGMDGEGVARLDNFVIFINGALLGEELKAQVTEVKKSFARAKIIKVLKPSQFRQQPLCPIFYRCGGCDMQHVNYKYSLSVKKANVKNCIEKELGREVEVNDVIYGEKLFGYRNKEQIPIRKVDGKARAGFYKQGSHIFVPFEKSVDASYGDCPLHDSSMQLFIDAIVDFINKEKISTYDEKTNTGIIRHIVIRRVDKTFSICLVINGNSIPNEKKLIQVLKNVNIPFNLFLSENKRITNVILGDKLTCIYGDDRIEGNALDIRFKVNPYSFLQVNDEIRDKIYSYIQKLVSENKGATVIDAYSGIGILSNILAKYAKKVVGIEIVPEAIKDANELAKTNGNSNIVNICGDAAIELPKVVNDIDENNTILVLDPPRKGCDDRVLTSICMARPNKIIYISCNPATLARDLKKLDSVYNIKSITPYDMFPQTKHVETVCLLTLKNQK